MQIIQIAEIHAKKNGADNVKAINLVIGEYSGCIGESVRLYFDIYASGTMCENAVLNIENIKPMLKCKVCGTLFERKPFLFACTKEGCEGEGLPTEIGTEFYIKSIEV